MAGKGAATAKSLYDVHRSVAMVQKSLAELKERTGRSLEEWTALIKKEGPERPEEPARVAKVEAQFRDEQLGVACGAG